MTMDFYGHLIDENLWEAAARLDKLDRRGRSGGTTGARDSTSALKDQAPDLGSGP